MLLASANATPNITNHGGKVLTNPITIYPIYVGAGNYGDWPVPSAQQTLLETFLSHLGANNCWGGPDFSGSAWWYQIWMNYGVSRCVRLFNISYYDLTTFPNGGAYDSVNVYLYLAAQINNGLLPEDPDGIYLFILSPHMTTTLPGTASWHGQFFKSSWLQYAVAMPVAVPPQNPSDPSPNSSPMDHQAEIIAHELSEAATDPLPFFAPGWYDSTTGYEIADVCQGWHNGFPGITSPVPYTISFLNGSNYSFWWIQDVWNPLKYDPSTSTYGACSSVP